MLLGKPSTFLDISDIDHKQGNVSFSVQNILNTDEYLMKTPQQKCKLGKGTPKTNKNDNKRDVYNQIRNAYHQDHKSKKKITIRKMKKKDALDQKDTVDNSQTFKLSNHCKSPKVHEPKKTLRKDSNSKNVQQKVSSNKIQPMSKSRSRTGSVSSLASPRKISQMQASSGHNTPSHSYLTIEKPSPSLVKARSQTIKLGKQELKAKNEDIIIQDYFYGHDKSPTRQHNKNGKNNRKRTLSSGKKIEIQSKRIKASTSKASLGNKLSPRSKR